MRNFMTSRRRMLLGSAAGAAGIAGLGAAGFAATAEAGTTEAPARRPGGEKHRRVKAKLAELGLELPAVAAPVGSYVPGVREGSLVFSAGQLPLVDGNLPATGKVGAAGGVSQEEAVGLARTAALNALAAMGTVVDLDRVTRVVKIVGYIASAEDFYNQSAVLNGASDLFAAVFGDAGKHARSAVGTISLPKNAPLEVEAVVAVR